MKKEARGKKGLVLGLVIGLVVLLLAAAAAAVVFLFILPGQQQTAVEEGTVKLYWNVDREANTDPDTGLSIRKPADDGVYYVRFACDGEQKEYVVTDKKLVNYIDTMAVMGLTFDQDGTVSNVVPATDVATLIGEALYVQEVTADTIIFNSALTMKGRKLVVNVTEQLQIYNVSGKGEFVGQAIKPDGIQIMDTVMIYGTLSETGDETDSVATHIFVTAQPDAGSVYWRADQFYDSETKGTKRVPDENGVYTVPFYCDGQTVDVKFKDKALVDEIDNGNIYYCHFAFEFDAEGYAVKIIGSNLATRTLIQGERLDIVEINEDGSFVAADVIKDSGREVRGVIDENCVIYDVSTVAKAEYAVNRKLDTLRLNDRVCIWSDAKGNPVLIYVTTRRVDSPAYYNPDLLYDSTTKLTTRTPNADGYYEIDLLKAGETELQTYYVKDVNAVTNIDKTSDFCVGLKVGEGNIVEYVYDMESVFGYSNFCRGYYVTNASSSVVSFAVDSYTKNGVLAADCKVWNVSTSGQFGAETTLQVGDYVYAARTPAGEVINVYIRRRMLGEDTMYWGLYTRMYDAANKVTTREPDADGYYVYDFANMGKQVTLRTNDKEIANFIDSYSAPGFSLVVKGDVILEANDGNYAAGGTKYNGWTVTAINEKEITVTTDGKEAILTLGMEPKIYNVSTSFEKAKGETTSLRVGDYISAYKDIYSEVAIIWVRGRETDTAAWPVRPQYDSATASTKRLPDAEGWYYIDLAINGQIKTVKTQNKAIVSGIDSHAYAIGVALDGDVIKSYSPITYVRGVKGAGVSNYTVAAVKGDRVDLVYTLGSADKTGDTQSVTLARNVKIYDVSNTATAYGAAATLQVGDVIRTYRSDDGQELYVYILAHGNRAGGYESYCSHCDKIVYWNPYIGLNNFAAYDGHYYLSGDVDATAQMRVYTDARDIEIVLDLNGHTFYRDGGRAALVRYNDTFTVIDSVGGGAIKVDNTNAMGGVMMVTDGGVLNLYGGTLERLDYADEELLPAQGGNIYASGAQIHIYGGTIRGGVVRGNEDSEGRGGNIYATSTIFTMSGGTIEGGKALSATIQNAEGEDTTSYGNGGNLCFNGTATVSITGGAILDGFSDYSGGNIYVLNKDIPLTIENSSITGGSASRGGNIYTSGTATLKNTTVADGTAAGNRGGNIYINGGVLNFTDGIVSGGTAGAEYGGNIYATNFGTINIYSGTVTDGTGSYGANVCVMYSTLNVYGGQIVGGSQASVYSIGTGEDKKATVNIAGGALTGEGYSFRANEQSVVTITGGTLEGETFIRKTTALVISGQPVIEKLTLGDGIAIIVGAMQAPASVKINAISGIFTAELVNASDAAPFFSPVNGDYKVTVTEDGKYLQVVSEGDPCPHCTGAIWQPWDGTASSGHYYLEADMQMPGALELAAGSELVLDLRGFTITAAAGKRVFYTYGNLAVLDTVGGGAITGGTAAGNRGGNIYVNGGNFTLYSGSVTNGTAEANCGGNIYATNAGTINILGGTVSGGTGSSGANIAVMYSTLNISGGQIIGADQASVYGIGTGEAKIAHINISGGTLTATGRAVRADEFCVLDVSGGTLRGETLIRKTYGVKISGAPVIEKLTLSTGGLITEIDVLEQGASIKISATSGVFTAELPNAAAAAAFFSAVNSNYKAAVTSDGKYLQIVAA